jgi:hypothetical protein
MPQIIISLVGSAVLLAGYLLSRKGKRYDEKAQQVQDQFTRMLSENTHLTSELDKERDRHQEDNAMWESRLHRQVDRCRKITESAVGTITHLMGRLTSEDQAAAEHMIEEINHHNADEHTP